MIYFENLQQRSLLALLENSKIYQSGQKLNFALTFGYFLVKQKVKEK
jgi:hypothetical protein